MPDDIRFTAALAQDPQRQDHAAAAARHRRRPARRSATPPRWKTTACWRGCAADARVTALEGRALSRSVMEGRDSVAAAGERRVGRRSEPHREQPGHFQNAPPGRPRRTPRGPDCRPRRIFTRGLERLAVALQGWEDQHDQRVYHRHDRCESHSSGTP